MTVLRLALCVVVLVLLVPHAAVAQSESISKIELWLSVDSSACSANRPSEWGQETLTVFAVSSVLPKPLNVCGGVVTCRASAMGNVGLRVTCFKSLTDSGALLEPPLNYGSLSAFSSSNCETPSWKGTALAPIGACFSLKELSGLDGGARIAMDMFTSIARVPKQTTAPPFGSLSMGCNSTTMAAHLFVDAQCKTPLSLPLPLPLFLPSGCSKAPATVLDGSGVGSLGTLCKASTAGPTGRNLLLIGVGVAAAGCVVAGIAVGIFFLVRHRRRHNEEVAHDVVINDMGDDEDFGGLGSDSANLEDDLN